MTVFNIYILFTIIIAGVVFIVSLINLLSAPVFKNKRRDILEKPVSVLIPARNEEAGLESCIKSVLSSNYNNYEVIIYDDLSTDSTFEIASDYAKKHSNVKVIKGTTLPEGWLGKNHACHNLANSAKGDYLLFLDADVNISPNTINNAVYNLEISNAGLLSIFPYQKLNTFGETLVVPLMNWVLLSFLPLIMVFKSQNKSFAAANGQFMLFNKNTYFEVGGHNAIKNNVLEDVTFCKKIKAENKKVITFISDGSVSCRMYSGFKSALNGFSKNFFAGFGFNYLLISLFMLLTIFVFLLPLFILPFKLIFTVPVTLVALSRVFISISSRRSIVFNLIFHPIQMLIVLFIGIKSTSNYYKRKSLWKERNIF